jgi:hypothetical protein
MPGKVGSDAGIAISAATKDSSNVAHPGTPRSAVIKETLNVAYPIIPVKAKSNQQQ